MKKISYLLTAACAVLVLSSCEDKKEPVYHAPTEGSFTLYAPAMQDQYIQLGESGTLALTTSGQPDYGYSAVAVYGAALSLTEDFAESYDLKLVNEHLSDITVNQSDVAIGVCTLLGLESEDDYSTMFPNGFQPMKLYFRASCQLSGVEGSQIVSNVVSYNNIVPYFAVPVPGYIYLIGDCSGWNEPAPGNAEKLKDWRLFEPDNAIGSGVYVGTFDIAIGTATFRFYKELTGWGANNAIGADEPDMNDVGVELVDGSYSGKAVLNGQSNWNITNFEGGKLTIVVDLSSASNPTVTFTAGEAGPPVIAQYIYMVGNQTGGWVEPSESNADHFEPWRLADTDGSGIYTGTFNFTEVGDNGNLYCRFYTALTGWGAAQYASADDGMVVTPGVAYPTVVGEGTFQLEGANGHEVSIVLDTNTHSVTFTFVN